MIDWKPTVIRVRDGSEHDSSLGDLGVPETPEGRSIRLRFLRLESPNAKAPTVVFLAGGPGDSGMQWAEHPPFFRAFDAVRMHAHVILLDQRGCGRSERDLRMRAPDQVPDDVFASEAAFRAFTLDHLRTNAERLRLSGAPLDSYTPVQSAHDLEAIRKALGLDRWSVWGYSYGTHLAQAYAKDYANSIERIVLCGFEGPDMTFKLPSRVQEQLVRLDARSPGLLHTMRSVHDQLEREPIRVPVRLRHEAEPCTMPVGAFVLRHLAATWSGVSNRFARLPTLYESLAHGDATVLARGLEDVVKQWTRPLTYFLKDAASGATKARWTRIRKEAPDCEVRDAINFPHPDAGPAIGAIDLGDEFREPLASALPILILTGSLDGFTPTENALEGVATLTNATHRVIHGAAHNDLITSPEVAAAIGAFLSTGAEPADSFDLPEPALPAMRSA